MKKSTLQTPPPEIFQDLIQRQKELEEEKNNLLVVAGKRLEIARQGYPRNRLERILGLSRNTFDIAENPRFDIASKKFGLQRVAELYHATVKLVEFLNTLKGKSTL
jgi:hypothetical protein